MMEDSSFVEETFMVDKYNLDDLERINRLGKGGFCNVYLVTTPDKRRLAMKELHLEGIDTLHAFVEAAGDLIQEAEILQQVQHKNIVGLSGISDVDPNIFLNSLGNSGSYFILLDVMIETLEDRLGRWYKDEKSWKRKARSSLSYRSRSLHNLPKEVDRKRMMERIRTVVLKVADAMEYLHDHDIIFQDLKPENIGFEIQSDELKIFDFGMARSVDPVTGKIVGEEEEMICGTPRYFAPEIFDFSGGSKETDVYAFGIMLHEICCMTVPFADMDDFEEFRDHICAGGRPDPWEIPDEATRKVIQDCTLTDPSIRPSFNELRNYRLPELLVRKEPDVQDNFLADSKGDIFGMVNMNSMMSIGFLDEHDEEIEYSAHIRLDFGGDARRSSGSNASMPRMYKISDDEASYNRGLGVSTRSSSYEFSSGTGLLFLDDDDNNNPAGDSLTEEQRKLRKERLQRQMAKKKKPKRRKLKGEKRRKPKKEESKEQRKQKKEEDKERRKQKSNHKSTSDNSGPVDIFNMVTSGGLAGRISHASIPQTLSYDDMASLVSGATYDDDIISLNDNASIDDFVMSINDEQSIQSIATSRSAKSAPKLMMHLPPPLPPPLPEQTPRDGARKKAARKKKKGTDTNSAHSMLSSLDDRSVMTGDTFDDDDEELLDTSDGQPQPQPPPPPPPPSLDRVSSTCPAPSTRKKKKTKKSGMDVSGHSLFSMDDNKSLGGSISKKKKRKGGKKADLIMEKPEEDIASKSLSDRSRDKSPKPTKSEDAATSEDAKKSRSRSKAPKKSKSSMSLKKHDVKSEDVSKPLSGRSKSKSRKKTESKPSASEKRDEVSEHDTTKPSSEKKDLTSEDTSKPSSERGWDDKSLLMSKMDNPATSSEDTRKVRRGRSKTPKKSKSSVPLKQDTISEDVTAKPSSARAKSKSRKKKPLSTSERTEDGTPQAEDATSKPLSAKSKSKSPKITTRKQPETEEPSESSEVDLEDTVPFLRDTSDAMLQKSTVFEDSPVSLNKEFSWWAGIGRQRQSFVNKL